MKVLVAGAGGMLGRDLVLAAGNAGHDVVGFGRAEMDVTDADAVRRQVDLERPDMVVNCAAWTDVDGAETAEDARLRGQRDRGRERRRRRARGRRRGRLRLHRLRLRRREGRALRRVRPARAAVRLRPHQAGRRGGDRGRQQAPLHRPLLRPLRDRRQELRRHDAAAGRVDQRGHRRPRPGHLADLHLAPRLRPHPADRGDRVRHPPHGRRRRAAPGTNSRARSSSRRRRRLQSALDHHRDVRPARAAAALSR